MTFFPGCNISHMKTPIFLLLLIVFGGACSTPKETPKKETPVVSRKDAFRGGTSFENPIVIRVSNERAGLDEEYKWLSSNYPGYSLVRRTQEVRSSRHYDIVRIRTKSGQLKDVYFDSTGFRKKG